MTTTMEGILKHLYFSTIHHPLLKLVPSQDIDISEDGWFLFRDDVPSRHCVLFGRLEGGMSMILHIIVSMFTCVCIQFGTTIQNNKQCPQYKASGWFCLTNPWDNGVVILFYDGQIRVLQEIIHQNAKDVRRRTSPCIGSS